MNLIIFARKIIVKMKIILKVEGQYVYSRDLPENAGVEEALFTACYILSRHYSTNAVKCALLRLSEDF